MNQRLRDMALAKLEGSTITIGDNPYLLHTLFSEKRYHEMAERQAVFFAQRAHDSQPAVIKLRIQLNPKMIDPRNRETHVKWAKRIFRDEVRALQDTAELPKTPALFDYSTDQQTFAYDYPGGYINGIAMQRMPGKPAPDYRGLTNSDVSHHKRSCSYYRKYPPKSS